MCQNLSRRPHLTTLNCLFLLQRFGLRLGTITVIVVFFPPAVAMANNAIARATWSGDVEAVRRLIDGEAGLVDARDAYQRTPLIMAATRGHLDVVRLLLERRPNVNAGDSRGYTALDWAATLGHLEIAQMLVREGGWW